MNRISYTVFLAECQVTWSWKTSFTTISWPWSKFSGTSWYSFPPCTQFKSPWFHSIVIWQIPLPLPLSGLCDKLEAIVGHNIMEALSFKIDVDGYVKPGWSAFPLRSQSHVVRDWYQRRRAQSCPRRYNPYPVNILGPFQSSSRLH